MGFALEQVLRIAKPDEAFFWATHQGAELDPRMRKGQPRIGVEFKRADMPTVTTSMRIAITDLKLNKLHVVHPGPDRYPMTTKNMSTPSRSFRVNSGLVEVVGVDPLDRVARGRGYAHIKIDHEIGQLLAIDKNDFSINLPSV